MPSFRGRPPYHMSEMIAAEPGLAERLIHRLSSDETVEQLVSAIREAATAGRPIITTGCGTSEHAAMGVAALLNEALDLPAGRGVRSIQALELLARPIADGLLIGISHEGGTHITNEALRTARASGARTALITVGGGSPGAALAELVIRTEEQDQSWCHTVGYLSPLLVGVVLAGRLSRSKVDALAIRALLDVADDPHAAASMASALAGIDRLIVVGVGADYVSARELALKVAEGARLPTAAHELETVLHGHLAAATRWTGLVLLLTTPGHRDGPIRRAKRPRARRRQGARGAGRGHPLGGGGGVGGRGRDAGWKDRPAARRASQRRCRIAARRRRRAPAAHRTAGPGARREPGHPRPGRTPPRRPRTPRLVAAARTDGRRSEGCGASPGARRRGRQP